MNTIDFLESLAEIKGIEKYRLIKFGSWKLLQDYLSSSKQNCETLKKVSDLTERTSLPFWDAAFIEGLINNDVINHEIIEFADHHNAIKEELWIPSKSILSYNGVNSDKMGINSLVMDRNGQLWHLPMMDFHIPLSSRGDEIVVTVCHRLGFNKGCVINSGKSYHFIGSEMMEEEQLMESLSRGLLYGPITDIRWIAHQLLEHSCTLRIGRKNGIFPKVIHEIQ